MADKEDSVAVNKVCIEKKDEEIIISFLDEDGNVIKSTKTINNVIEALTIDFDGSSMWIGLK